MNIKSLLLGSAAAAVAFTGAQAADAIIIAEPEPMEYVRICDTYGTGFFYIPGTENCMRIGGTVRYEMRYQNFDVSLDGDSASDDSFSKFARFAPYVDVRNATEWGTLRSYAEVEFDWTSGAGNTSTNLAHAFISLDNGSGVFTVGKTDTPYHNRALGGLHNGGIFLTVRGNNSSMNDTSNGIVSYTFNAGNGLSFTGAVVENTDNSDFEPNLEAVLRYSQGWGVIVGAVGFDNEVNEWGGKIAAEIAFNPVTVGLQAQYGSSWDSAYGARYADGVGFIGGTTTAGLDGGFAPSSEWSVAAYARASLTDTLAIKGGVQWFDGGQDILVFDGLGGSTAAELDDAWQVNAGLDWQPVTGLSILPEIRYTKIKADLVSGEELKADVWEARLRFNRSF